MGPAHMSRTVVSMHAHNLSHVIRPVTSTQEECRRGMSQALAPHAIHVVRKCLSMLRLAAMYWGTIFKLEGAPRHRSHGPAPSAGRARG